MVRKPTGWTLSRSLPCISISVSIPPKRLVCCLKVIFVFRMTKVYNEILFGRWIETWIWTIVFLWSHYQSNLTRALFFNPHTEKQQTHQEMMKTERWLPVNTWVGPVNSRKHLCKQKTIIPRWLQRGERDLIRVDSSDASWDWRRRQCSLNHHAH